MKKEEKLKTKEEIRKEMAEGKHNKFIGMMLISFGGILTLTVIFAIIGIPMILLGLFIWAGCLAEKFNKKKK